MAETAITKPLPVNEPSESKSARKKKSKAATATSNGVNGGSLSPAVPEVAAKDPSDTTGEATNGTYEHPHIRELQKQIRNINKRLTGLQKTDAIIKDNPGVSLEQLVAQKKINADQKAAAEKKPHLQAQLQSLEEQVVVFKQVDADYQAQMQKLKDDLAKQHEKELEKVKADTHAQLTESNAKELEQKLLVFSHFLRTAAAKRTVEEDATTPENMAFEGALLLVYGGDQKAVETAVSIINGTDEQVPSIEGNPLSFTYAQVRQASIDHAPFQSEEAWVDSVNEANKDLADDSAQPGADVVPSGSDPTVANAGLTELESSAHPPNGITAEADRDAITSPAQGSAGDEAGNLAGDRWDSTAAGAAQEGMEDSYEMVPRPNDEVDTPAIDRPTLVVDGVQEKTNWADDATAAAEPVSTSNAAAEGWDLKAPGQGEDTAWSTAATEGTNPTAQTDNWADSTNGDATPAPAAPAQGDDGFQQIPNRHQRGGRGGGRGRGDGEFRGRGRGGRGGYRPEFRGGGMRGSRGGDGYRGDRGDRGGRGGRGRGNAPRGGDGPAQPRS